MPRCAPFRRPLFPRHHGPLSRESIASMRPHRGSGCSICHAHIAAWSREPGARPTRHLHHRAVGAGLRYRTPRRRLHADRCSLLTEDESRRLLPFCRRSRATDPSLPSGQLPMPLCRGSHLTEGRSCICPRTLESSAPGFPRIVAGSARRRRRRLDPDAKGDIGPVPATHRLHTRARAAFAGACREDAVGSSIFQHHAHSQTARMWTSSVLSVSITDASPGGWSNRRCRASYTKVTREDSDAITLIRRSRGEADQPSAHLSFLQQRC